ncbi:ferredoxin family protein [Chloroflexota bacterium]
MPVIFTERNKALHVKPERCKGCGICIEVCPVQALEHSLELNSKGFSPPSAKNNGKCNMCTLCEYMCPDNSIFILPLIAETILSDQTKAVSP